MRRTTTLRILIIASLLSVSPLLAEETLPSPLRANIDKAVTDLLTKSGAPSASVAVVTDGKIAYTHAYGTAQLETKKAATPQMRYSIGSISKQFTSASILLLAEEGRLSLDDKIVRWLPELTRARDVSIRQLLSMTSGYQDFWPQDYVMPMMLKDVRPDEIARRWGQIPLDFEPGSKWQYSNTNYVIAGIIIEKVAGVPVMEFLQKRIFEPLHMTSVTNSDVAELGKEEPTRYLRYALGPPRLAPKEGRGWMFAAGELAMTAGDLARWDLSVIDQTILHQASYRELTKEVQLTSGIGSRYGLGVSLSTVDGRRLVSHGGEVSGFTARNDIYPEDRAAVVVLTNLDATNASEQIATKIGTLIFATTDPGTQTALNRVQSIFHDLQKGKVDRSLFTANASSYLSDAALKDFASSLGPLGTPQEFTQLAQSLRGGMTLRRYRIKFPDRTLRLTTFTMPDGKLEQYQIAAVE
ncbi:MAG TPA: serine hydrolase domain-containing protein [Thermoanaerobaculia bacterium]|nr:serine hydrolase domain-containing protein [Thermoanaerobaculia bacterium]